MSIYANTRDIDNSVILTRPFKVLTQMYIAIFNNVFHIICNDQYILIYS